MVSKSLEQWLIHHAGLKVNLYRPGLLVQATMTVCARYITYVLFISFTSWCYCLLDSIRYLLYLPLKLPVHGKQGYPPDHFKGFVCFVSYQVFICIR